MLFQASHDAFHIPCRRRADGREVLLFNIGLTEPHDGLDGRVVNGCLMLPHDRLPNGEHALMGSVLFREALAQHRAAVVDVHDVHGSVSDVAEHVGALEAVQLRRDGGIALGKYVRVGKRHMVLHAVEGEVGGLVLEQVFTKRLLLLADPGQWQSDRQVDAGGGQPTELQFPGDGSERQDVVIGIVDLAGQEGLVFLADDVILALVHQHIVGKDRFCVVCRHAGLKVPVRCLYATIAVVDGDDDVSHGIYLVFLINSAVTAARLRSRLAR